MYAIIATGGKQYKVAEGDVIKVERLGAAAGEAVTFDQVLAVNNGEMKIGCPTVDGASVSATVVKEGKGKKVIVYKYKSKTGYHKKNGHRQLYTEVKIDKINTAEILSARQFPRLHLIWQIPLRNLRKMNLRAAQMKKRAALHSVLQGQSVRNQSSLWIR